MVGGYQLSIVKKSNKYYTTTPPPPPWQTTPDHYHGSYPSALLAVQSQHGAAAPAAMHAAMPTLLRYAATLQRRNPADATTNTGLDHRAPHAVCILSCSPHSSPLTPESSPHPHIGNHVSMIWILLLLQRRPADPPPLTPPSSVVT